LRPGRNSCSLPTRKTAAIIIIIVLTVSLIDLVSAQVRKLLV
jgi:ABC-type phosphate/phosphonate transport system permease subunit